MQVKNHRHHNHNVVSCLMIVRHGQSTWNEKNLFAGWQDVELTAAGQNEAKNAAKKIAKANLVIQRAFTSKLKRAIDTLEIIMQNLELDVETTEDKALNERDYGELTGINKEEAKKKWTEKQVHLWRRSFSVAPPNGESLEMVANNRVLPYFQKNILPELKQGKNTIIVAHGNSLRAIVMQLEKLSPLEIVDYEIANAEPILYFLHHDDSFHLSQI